MTEPALLAKSTANILDCFTLDTRIKNGVGYRI